MDNKQFSSIQLARKAGYPFRIVGNGGYPATLTGIQPFNDGTFAGLYRYPGGVCFHTLDEIQNCFKIIEK